jgi:hypothetical protein
MTKRQRIEAYLNQLAPEQLRNLTVRELTADLANEGLEVTERYVKYVLDQRRPTPRQPRRRGSGPAAPADDRHGVATQSGTGPPAPGARP